ncbi:hypothetical protein V8F20_000687 [Naviculisporaceae sp. PSN 640]
MWSMSLSFRYQCRVSSGPGPPSIIARRKKLSTRGASTAPLMIKVAEYLEGQLAPSPKAKAFFNAYREAGPEKGKFFILRNSDLIINAPEPFSENPLAVSVLQAFRILAFSTTRPNSTERRFKYHADLGPDDKLPEGDTTIFGYGCNDWVAVFTAILHYPENRKPSANPNISGNFGRGRQDTTMERSSFTVVDENSAPGIP